MGTIPLRMFQRMVKYPSLRPRWEPLPVVDDSRISHGTTLRRALQQRPPEQSDRLPRAEEHAHQAAGDPRRAGSEAAGGEATTAGSLIGRVKKPRRHSPGGSA